MLFIKYLKNTLYKYFKIFNYLFVYNSFLSLDLTLGIYLITTVSIYFVKSHT